MECQKVLYKQKRSEMKPGDLIAFSGKTPISKLHIVKKSFDLVENVVLKTFSTNCDNLR